MLRHVSTRVAIARKLYHLHLFLLYWVIFRAAIIIDLHASRLWPILLFRDYITFTIRFSLFRQHYAEYGFAEAHELAHTLDYLMQAFTYILCISLPPRTRPVSRRWRRQRIVKLLLLYHFTTAYALSYHFSSKCAYIMLGLAFRLRHIRL